MFLYPRAITLLASCRTKRTLSSPLIDPTFLWWTEVGHLASGKDREEMSLFGRGFLGDLAIKAANASTCSITKNS